MAENQSHAFSESLFAHVECLPPACTCAELINAAEGPRHLRGYAGGDGQDEEVPLQEKGEPRSPRLYVRESAPKNPARM